MKMHLSMLSPTFTVFTHTQLAKVASFRNTAHLLGRQETPESFEATFIQRIGTTAED